MKNKEKTNKKYFVQLRKNLQALGFRKLSLAEIVKNNQRLGLEFPRRVNDLTHVQDQFIYANRNGYQVVVIPSILNDRLLEQGRSWVLITEDHRLIWSRFFLKNVEIKSLCEKLIAYAQFAQNVVDYRPLCPKSSAFMDLVEERENFMYRGGIKTRFVFYWRSDYADYSFKEFQKLYEKGIPRKLVDIILMKELARERYLKKRTAKQFARDMRGVARTTRIRNSITRK